ncbi:MAG: ATP synthase subunit I [Desulfovibrionaceae bacterium]
MNRKLETLLYQWGFEQNSVRALVRNQIWLAAASSLVLLVLTLGSRFALSYTAGAVIITLNFVGLAKLVSHLVHYRRGAVFSLLVIFYGKLIFTGLVLYALIAWAGASMTGLLCGLSTAVAMAVAWGAQAMLRHKPKEA